MSKSKEISDVLSTTEEIELGSQKYKVKSITLGDIADFQKWCDKQKKKEIIELYKLAEKEVDVREIMQITGDEKYYNTMMNTLDGVIFLLHKVIHKSNKTDITVEQIAEQLDTDNLQEIVEVLFGNFAEEEIKETQTTEKKVKAKSQQKI